MTNARQSPVPELFIAREFPAEGERLLAFNPDGTRLAVSHQDADRVQVFDTRSGEEVAACTDFFRVSGVLFLSSEVLLVAAYGGCFRCNLRRGSRDLLSKEGWQTSMTLSPDGRVLAIGVSGGLAWFDLVKKKELRRFRADFEPSDVGYHAGFSPGMRYLAADLHSSGRAGNVIVWDARTGHRQRVFGTKAYAFAFRGDTLTLAVSADSGYVELYTPNGGEVRTKEFFFDYHIPRAMEFRNRGRALAMLMGNGEFVQVETATGRVVRRLPRPAGSEPFEDVVSTENWMLFAGATAAGVVIWPGDRARRGS